MDLKPKDVKKMLETQNTIESTESEAGHDALDPGNSSGESWTGTDGSVRLSMNPMSPRATGGIGQTAGPGGTTSIEHLPGNRIDCGAFEVDAMADDMNDDFNGTLNVSAQDKTTGKPNEMLEEVVQGLKLELINGCCAPRSKRAGAKSCTPPVDSGLTTPVHNCDAPCMLKPSSQMLHQDPFLWTPITPKVLAGGITTHPCEIALGSLSSRDGVESSWGASLQQQPDRRPALNADTVLSTVIQPVHDAIRRERTGVETPPDALRGRTPYNGCDIAHVPSNYLMDEGGEEKEHEYAILSELWTTNYGHQGVARAPSMRRVTRSGDDLETDRSLKTDRAVACADNKEWAPGR